MKPLTQTALLRRRCQRILAEQRRRAARDGIRLPYGLDELLTLAGKSIDCAYCRMPVGLDLQLDHMLPLARGGAHALHNLCVCCSRCNRLKSKLAASEFRQLLALFGVLGPVAGDDIERRLLSGAKLYARNRGKK